MKIERLISLIYKRRNFSVKEKRELSYIICANLGKYEKSHRIRKMAGNITLLLVAFIAGSFSNWIISSHFEKIDSQIKKELLLNNMVFELELNLNQQFYYEFNDSASYLSSARQFPYLQSISIQELYKNLYLFEESTFRNNLASKIVILKEMIEFFNNNIGLRNSAILVDMKIMKALNPGTFKFYHSSLVPQFNNLLNFINDNKEKLINPDKKD